jgi:endoglucanase
MRGANAGRDPKRWRKAALIPAILTAVILPCGPSASAQTSFNYAEALQKAIWFYEAQISGPKPPWSRVSWRGDSALQDGSDVGRDLTGGWFDAGDHVKFGFAMASSATMLAWGGVEYRTAFESKGQLTHLLNNLRWVNDYFIKAHGAPNELWGHVGEGGSDHAFWGSAEVMHLRTNRPADRIDAACGGSDLAAETAAAMAAASIVFRPTDTAYANTLLTHARQLFAFAEATHPSFYVDCIPDASGFYNSRFGNPNDEMAWAAAWLFRATNEAAFLTRARQLYATMCTESGTTTPCFTWSQSWNDKHFGTYILMAKATGEQAFHADAQRWLDYWTVGAGAQTRRTPGGLIFVHNFGSIRYATNAAFLALVYADVLGPSHSLYSRYHDFAKRQVDYALGANPRNSSYLCGFGNNPPRNPHHRTAHGTWTNNPTGEPNPSVHTLFGGLVGGPDAQDDLAWSDDRNLFMRTEVATDFNAGLTGALARLAQEFGGNSLASFPPLETPQDEIFVDAQINVQGTNFTEIRAFLTNRSAWPARILNQGSFRYFFTLEPGVTPGQITISRNFSQCGSAPVTGPTLFSGNTYFVTVSCVGTGLYPGGQSEHRREVQFRIASSGAWDPANDFSFQGLTSSQVSRTRNLPAYDNGVRVWGDEPGPPTPDFTLTAAPASVTVNQGATATSTITITRTGGFAGSVSLSASGLPTGVTASFSPASTTGTSSVVTFTATAAAAAGTFPVTITGAATGQTPRTTPISLTVAGAGFSLSAAPASVTVNQSSTATSTITIARTGGFAGSVALSAGGLPTGVTASFSPASTTGTSSVVTFTATATAAAGTFPVTITGTATGQTPRTTPISLTVAGAGFSLSAAPASLTVNQGSTATSTITIARTGGFAGSVSLSASGLPTGVTASFSPASTTGTSSVVTFTATTTAATGTLPVTVTGTATGLTPRTTSINLTVSGGGTGGVTVTAAVTSSSPWFNEQQIQVANTANLTALTVTIVIQRTTGISFNGQYNTVGSQIQQSNSSTATAITYQFTLAAGQILGPATNRTFAAQTSGSGTAHPTSGDTYTVTYTTGGQSFTQSGNFP